MGPPGNTGHSTGPKGGCAKHGEGQAMQRATRNSFRQSQIVLGLGRKLEGRSMRGTGRILGALAGAVLMAAGVATAHAGDKLKVLHSFCVSHRGCSDGSNPADGLVMDTAGNLYGTAPAGGLDFGTVFELEAKGGGG